MAIINGKDVYSDLLEPAHDTPFPRIQRMLDRYFTFVPELDIERAVIWTDSYKETEAQPAIIRRAKAFKKYAEERSILINDDDLFLGKCSTKPRAGTVAPEYISSWLAEEIDGIAARERDTYQVTPQQIKTLREDVFPYWEGKTIFDGWINQISPEAKKLMVKTGIIDADVKVQSAPGEMAPSFKMALNIGFNGFIKQANEYKSRLDPVNHEDWEKINFYDATIMTMEAMKIYIHRCADEARKAADTADETRRKELMIMADNADFVAENTPETFYQALQLWWFTFIGIQMEGNSPGVSPGRVDQYLYPFYRTDCEKGILDDSQALEYIEALYLATAENTWVTSENASQYFTGYQAFINICVGGIDEFAKDASNSLSYLFITAKMHVRLHSPNLSVRIHKDTPQELLLHIARLVRYGTGYPAIHCDDVGIKMMLSLGVTMKEAYDYQLVGCVEPFVSNKMSKWSDAGHYNFGAAIEFVLTNGRSLMNNNEILGVQTGDPTKMTFEEIKDAVKEQLKYFAYQMACGATITERLHAELAPLPFISALLEGCYEKGKDINNGGPKYCEGPAFIGTGLTDLVNSLSAIKKFVFDDKVISMQEMIDACVNDFEGYEEIHKLVTTKTPCWGNDIPEIDEWAAEFSDYIRNEIVQYHSYRGRPFNNALYPVTSNVPHGLMVGALPYGRHAGKPLADGVSPNHGTDREGPTAVLKSVANINHEQHTSGTLLNMRLDPVSVEGDLGLQRICQIIRTMVDLEIWHIQFNVIKTETLLAAQKEPEKFKTLIVRVSGYSAYFGELNKEVQDDVIGRTMHAVH
ncbi:formate C-acetyltransferase/glycerol dehydratase family glycyl radical enzyme [Anaerovorax odorimutans]|nr:formate C-acetyltransferase/glycerol dehydratase family glycyl radical enzyme [Anaerovorax odorimutans]